MKIFLDTANLDEIREAAKLGVVSGITTNPTLLAKEEADFEETIKEICRIIDGPVSAEVVSLKADEMIEEGRRLSSWHPHVVVKVPITAEGLKAIKALSSEGIQVNTTLIFSVNQALLAALAGAAYVSPFIGRLDDVSEDGMQLVRDIVVVFRNYHLPAQVLAASIRHPLHLVEAAKAGAHVATMPYKVLMQALKHPLTDIGLERFLADWQRLQEARAAEAPAARKASPRMAVKV